MAPRNVSPQSSVTRISPNSVVDNRGDTSNSTGSASRHQSSRTNHLFNAHDRSLSYKLPSLRYRMSHRKNSRWYSNEHTQDSTQNTPSASVLLRKPYNDVINRADLNNPVGSCDREGSVDVSSNVDRLKPPLLRPSSYSPASGSDVLATPSRNTRCKPRPLTLDQPSHNYLTTPPLDHVISSSIHPLYQDDRRISFPPRIPISTPPSYPFEFDTPIHEFVPYIGDRKHPFQQPKFVITSPPPTTPDHPPPPLLPSTGEPKPSQSQRNPCRQSIHRPQSLPPTPALTSPPVSLRRKSFTRDQFSSDSSHIKPLHLNTLYCRRKRRNRNHIFNSRSVYVI